MYQQQSSRCNAMPAGMAFPPSAVYPSQPRMKRLPSSFAWQFRRPMGAWSVACPYHRAVWCGTPQAREARQ
jgi:hypothetical protein